MKRVGIYRQGKIIYEISGLKKNKSGHAQKVRRFFKGVEKTWVKTQR